MRRLPPSTRSKCSVEELLASPSIDLVLNLTPPLAHVAVTRSALEAGKHVYSEKPLAVTAADAAELVGLAGGQGKRIGCAPDIFLGRAYQTARALLDEGAIGEPLAASAAMVGGGQERGIPIRTSSSGTVPGRCWTWGRTT